MTVNMLRLVPFVGFWRSSNAVMLTQGSWSLLWFIARSTNSTFLAPVVDFTFELYQKKSVPYFFTNSFVPSRITQHWFSGRNVVSSRYRIAASPSAVEVQDLIVAPSLDVLELDL